MILIAAVSFRRAVVVPQYRGERRTNLTPRPTPNLAPFTQNLQPKSAESLPERGWPPGMQGDIISLKVGFPWISFVARFFIIASREMGEASGKELKRKKEWYHGTGFSQQ